MKTLKEIIELLGNKDYEYIEFRCLYTVNKKTCDEFYGACKYKDKQLYPIDYDSYSLNDKFIKWKEWEKHGKKYLTVWTECEVIRG